MTAAQGRQLKKRLPHTHDVRQYRKSLAVLECMSGKVATEVEQSQHVTRQSIHKWIHRSRRASRSDALIDGRHTGRPRHANSAVGTLLQDLMGTRPYSGAQMLVAGSVIRL